jgi:hypothetical protein
MRCAESHIQYIWQLCVLPSSKNASINILLLDQSCLTIWLVWIELAQFLMFLTCFGKAPASKLGRDTDRHDCNLPLLFSVSPGKYRCLKLGCILYIDIISKSFPLFIQRIFLTVHVLTNKMNKIKYNKTDHKKHFILGTNCYMFRHQDAILREFITSWYLIWGEF